MRLIVHENGDQEVVGLTPAETAELEQMAIVTPPPDWAGLLKDLRGSEPWAKSFAAASTSIAANSAWTLLYGTLTGTRHLPDLMFAIGALRSAMVATEGGDFTEAEVNTINAIMTSRGFPAL